MRPLTPRQWILVSIALQDRIDFHKLQRQSLPVSIREGKKIHTAIRRELTALKNRIDRNYRKVR